jgi:hypothetical protein
MALQVPRARLPRRRTGALHRQGLHPDAPTGLCVMLMQQVAVGWIVAQERNEVVKWTLKSAECVTPDDEKL